MKKNIFTFSIFVRLWLSTFLCSVSGKQCTNDALQYASSSTMQYKLLTASSISERDEMHPIPTDEATWSKLRPRYYPTGQDDGTEEFNWAMFYRDLKYSANGRREEFLKEVSLHDVRLDPNSKHGQAQQTNMEYLLLLDLDNLIWSFRRTAGVRDPPGKPYGGWEGPTIELRGHFVGHYMSATARMWASTHNKTLYDSMTTLVQELKKCQDILGTGYLSAFPSYYFDRLEAGQKVWAPYYTVHKIMAGLLDQYTFAENNDALDTVVKMVGYFSKRVANVISIYTIEKHWDTLNEECGGMNDLLYRLYGITGDRKHLVLANLFDKPCFLGLLAMRADSLSGFHVNSHIPIVIGSQEGYEVTGDPLYKAMGTYFMDIMNSSHCYATGGSSLNEHWTDANHLATSLDRDNEESCTTYNLLKVSRNLFRWTKDMAYADHYERALTNGVLSIQRGTEPGVMIYFLPLGRGQSKARSQWGWGTKYDAMWCCYGTGIESFSKLGDSIYFEEEANIPGLYIIQYISNTFNWKAGKAALSLEAKPIVSTDPQLNVSLTIATEEAVNQPSTLNLRIPFWTNSNGAKAALNGESLSLPLPGNFMKITRTWQANDRLNIQLPIDLRLEKIKDNRPEYANLQAILYGPYLLAGLTSGEYAIRTQEFKSLYDWIVPIPPYYNSQLISLTHEVGNESLAMVQSDNYIMMKQSPEYGTDAAMHATFRVITRDANSSPENLFGKSVMLEPFDLPGMMVTHQGPDKVLKATNTSGVSDAEFQVVPGLDKKQNTVSLESESQHGCFIYRNENQVELRCRPSSEREDTTFDQAVSFKFSQGLSEYHPISFVMNTAEWRFLLVPLLSLRDETYTIYFNILP